MSSRPRRRSEASPGAGMSRRRSEASRTSVDSLIWGGSERLDTLLWHNNDEAVVTPTKKRRPRSASLPPESRDIKGVVDTILAKDPEERASLRDSLRDDQDDRVKEEDDDCEDEDEDDDSDSDDDDDNEDGEKRKKTKKKRRQSKQRCPNTVKIRDAMEALVEDKSGNSETGANYLRKLVMPEFAFDTVDDATGANPWWEDDDTTEVDAELIAATSTTPDERTPAELNVIARHLGAHPFFNIARGMLKARLLRHVTLVRVPRAFTVAVLQNELADAAFLVYSGKFAVHGKPRRRASLEDPDSFAPDLREKLLSSEKKKHVFQDAAEYAAKSRELLGNRFATLCRGQAFGEHGFDPAGTDAPTRPTQRRTATVISTSEGAYLFRLARSTVLAPKPRATACTSFAGAPHPELLEVLSKPAAERTDFDVELVHHHCSWQPFLSVLEPCLADAVCRHLKLVDVPKDECVVLQGDVADCYFVIYHGSAEVYVAKDDADDGKKNQKKPPKLTLRALNRWKGENLWAPAEKVTSPPRIPVATLGQKVFVLQQGMAFGENGLDANDVRRNATVVSCGSTQKGPLKLLCLKRDDVRAAPLDAVKADDLQKKLVTLRSDDGREYVFEDVVEPHWTRSRFRVVLDRTKKRRADDGGGASPPSAEASPRRASASQLSHRPRSAVSPRSAVPVVRRPSSHVALQQPTPPGAKVADDDTRRRQSATVAPPPRSVHHDAAQSSARRPSAPSVAAKAHSPSPSRRLSSSSPQHAGEAASPS